MAMLRRIFTLALLLFCANVVSAELVRYEGRVVGVTDGDTITVLDDSNVQHKVRLMGIDAPEKSQAFGNVSRQHLAARMFSKTVTVVYSKTDRYRREIGKVLLDDEDINLEQVVSGLAWHYKKYAREQSPEDQDNYTHAEVRARILAIGLWSLPSPVPPWDYRRRR